MFENYIEIEKDKASAAIDFAYKYIYLPDLLDNEKLHDSYKAFISAEIDWWVYQERMLRETNLNFDMQSDEIQELFLNLDELLRKKARFDRIGFDRIINAAVRTRINMICRPRVTLKWFVYKGEPTRPYNEVMKKLNYFFDYEYLINGLKERLVQAYSHSDGRELVSAGEFERMVVETDNEMILDLNPEEYVEMLKPAFEFFNTDKQDDEDIQLPVEALIIFHDDKGIVPISAELEYILNNSRVSHLNRETFIEIIEKMLDDSYSVPYYENEEDEPVSDVNVFDAGIHSDVDSESNEVSEDGEIIVDPLDMPAESLETDFQENARQSGQEDEGPQAEIATTDIKDRNNDFLKQFLSEEEEEGIKNEEILRGDVSVSIDIFDDSGDKSETTETESDKNLGDVLPTGENGFVEVENGVSEDLLEAELSDEEEITFEEEITLVEEIVSDGDDKGLEPMSKIIDDKMGAKFIKKLFSKDEDSYKVLLGRLEPCASWREAATTVDLYFSEKGIDPNAGLAEDFRLLLQSRYI